MFIVSFTEGGFITQEAIYRFRNDLDIQLVFLWKRAAATAKKKKMHVIFYSTLFSLVEYTVGALGTHMLLAHLQLDTTF